MSISKSRNWLVTLNQFTDKDLDVLKDICKHHSISYCVFGREKAPSTGHEHLQGFVHFKNARNFRGVKKFFKMLASPNLQIGNDRADKMAAYCKKDGDFWEFGKLPVSKKDAGSKGGKTKAVNFGKVIKLAEEGKLDIIKRKYPKQFLAYYRTLQGIHKDFGVMPPDLDGVTGVWIYGPSGGGKSHYAREAFPGCYDKACNKWFDNYKGEKNILLDDFGKTHAVLGHHLKRWSDRYAFSAEIKGSQINLRPDFIVITSQYRIGEIWTDIETVDALNRRFTKIKIHIDSQGNRVIQPQGY